ncbi:MAG: small nuclear ribonucleoprotein [Candidatus Diapherotrites archaeon]|nr:small nuclear ribonucleoprotein [Candidatus Diapherotrites archaeon]
MAERPFDLLTEAIGKEVLIILKDSVAIRGKLKSFDVHMNISLEEAVELKDGEISKRYGTVIIRGDNILLISV